MIASSVGRNGINAKGDVRTIQVYLNGWIAVSRTINSLAIDGIVGPKTIGAIERFQRAMGLGVDGRIDAGGPTLRKLAETTVAIATQAIDNSGYGQRWKNAVAAENRPGRR